MKPTNDAPARDGTGLNSGRGVALMAAGLFLFAAAAYGLRLMNWVPAPDELGYAYTGRSLIDGQPYALREIYFFPPVFVAASALLQRLGVEPLLSVRTLSAVAGAGIVALSYLVLCTAYPRRVAAICALLLTGMYGLACFSRQGQVETAHLVFCFASVLGLLNWAQAGGRWRLFAAGLSLGVAAWVKESALIWCLSSALFVALQHRVRPSRPALLDLAVLTIGASLLIVPLLIVGAVTGSSVLFELSRSRLVDIVSRTPLEEVREVLGNLIFLLVGGNFLRMPSWTLGVPLLIAAAVLLAARTWPRRPAFGLMVISFAVVSLPFFAWFDRKYVYYLLPMAVFTHMLLFAETAMLMVERRAAPAMRGGAGRSAAGIAMAGLLAAACAGTVPHDRSLYKRSFRGSHEWFPVALERFDAGSTIAVSHADVFDYINRRQGLGLTLLPLFLGATEDLDWDAIDAPGVEAVVTKGYYAETLTRRDAADWRRLRERFPRSEACGDLILMRRDSATAASRGSRAADGE